MLVLPLCTSTQQMGCDSKYGYVWSDTRVHNNTAGTCLHFSATAPRMVSSQQGLYTSVCPWGYVRYDRQLCSLWPTLPRQPDNPYNTSYCNRQLSCKWKRRERSCVESSGSKQGKAYDMIHHKVDLTFIDHTAQGESIWRACRHCCVRVLCVMTP